MARSRSSLAAVVAAGLVVLVLQGPAPAAGPPTLTKPAHSTIADVDPGRMYSSPALAVDPRDPMRIVAGFADLRTRRCGIVRSLDGGRTWVRPEGSPAPPTYPFCSQSQGGVIQAPIAFGADGMLYMGLGGWGEEEGARTGGAVMVARSPDLGDSWETVIVRTARGKTGEDAENLRPVQSIAVEGKGGGDDVVYITYALTRPGLTGPNSVPARPMVAVSRDGGRSFTEHDLVGDIFEPQPVRDQAIGAATTTTVAPGSTTTTTRVPPPGSRAAEPNQAANFGAAGSRNGMVARLDGKGNAYVIWPTGTANLEPSPPPGMALSKSTDGGRTWSSALAIPFSYENARGGPANAYSQLAVTREGTLHIVYNQNPKPDVANYSEIFHRASYDGGTTWTDPKSLRDDDPGQYAGKFFPNLSVAENGRVDVAWWDTRDTPGQRFNDVYYAYSTDDGRTWSRNIRVTDRSVDRRVGVWGQNYDIASQPGVASTNAYAVLGWDDTRNTDTSVGDNTYLGGGLQDIYIGAAQFEAIGGGSSRTAKIVLAGIVGLLVVGLVLVLAAAMSRRGTAGGPSTPV
ncbi:MAG: glycoside hydrolase, partial [Actinomycetota bacterium]|nr:glycoside hydrolase [Actinomycetota bacterium]